MGASNFPGLKLSKGTHGSLQVEAVRKARRSKDERESDKVRARSGGRCEISVIGERACPRKAVHVHHMIGGRMRARGASALADHKQHCCENHHRDIGGSIGGKRLKRVGGEVPWFTDRYERIHRD